MTLFIETYAYEVPESHIDRYLDIQRRTRQIYLRHGCLAYEVFRSDDGRCLEICRFEDREHYEGVTKSVDQEPEIGILWKEFCSIVSKDEVSAKKYGRIL